MLPAGSHFGSSSGLSDASKAKYGWPPSSASGRDGVQVNAALVFAFPLKQIATAVTKWAFD
jgi:hypothetical protein